MGDRTTLRRTPDRAIDDRPAIPALIAYNLFRNQALSLGNDLRDFSRELSNRIEWILYEQFVMARK